mgnify:FL=1
MSDSTDNTQNLDSYGVWVKTPPQDADKTTESDLTVDAAMPDFSDLDLSATATEEPSVSDDFNFDSISTEESSISAQEASGLEQEATDSAEAVSMEDFTADLPDFGSEEAKDVTNGDSAIEDDSGMPAFEEVSFDDMVSDSDGSEGEGSSGDEEISLDDFMDGDFSDPNPSATTEAVSADSFGDGEISLDDFLDDDSSSKQKEDDITDDQALDIDLSFTENADEEVPLVENNEEEDFADGADSETQETSEFDDMFDSIDAGEFSATDEGGASSDGSAEVSLDEFTSDGESASSSSGDSEEIDLADFGIDSEAEETAVHQDVQEAKKNQIVDYNLAISEDDTGTAAPSVTDVPESSEGGAEQNAAAVSIPANATVVDNSILDRIMQELSGLKNEINTLKTDFETLKQQEPASAVPQETPFTAENEPETPVAAPEAEIPEADSEPSIPEDFSSLTEEMTAEATDENVSAEAGATPEPQENTGFFSDDDEDETIALSGNELDNIMNTADFTEVDAEDSAENSEEEAPAEEEASTAESAEEPGAELELPIEIPESEETGGFFSASEDEDDTIALSGNELDNIMNTADFTEAVDAEDEQTDETGEKPEAVADDTVPAGEPEAAAEAEIEEEAASAPEFSVEADDGISLDEALDGTSEEENVQNTEEELSEPEADEANAAPTAEEDLSEEPSATEEDDSAAQSQIPADFTDDEALGAIEEDIEIPSDIDSGLSLDVSDETLEEPVFENAEEEPESEISIPKVEDFSETEAETKQEDSILVESSSDDFMESVCEAESTESVSEGEPEASKIPEEPIPSIPTSESADIPVEDIDADAVIDDILAPEPEIGEAISEENLDYLKEDKNIDSAEITMESAEEDPFPSIEAVQEPENESAESESDALPTDSEELLAEPQEVTAAEDAEELPSEEAETSTALSDEELEIDESRPEAEPIEKMQAVSDAEISDSLKNDVKSVLLYMDQLLENLPEDKIVEFAKSEQFTTYKRLFNELGLS